MNDKETVHTLSETSEFFKNIKLLNENIGIVTLFSTLSVACISAVLRGLMYVFERGRLDYWSINSSYINVLQENQFYNLFLHIAIAILVLAVNIIPYAIITSQSKWWVKGVLLISIIFIIGAIYAAYMVVSICTDVHLNAIDVLKQIFAYAEIRWVIIVYPLLLSILTLFMGTLLGATDKWVRDKSHQESTKKNFSFLHKTPKWIFCIFAMLLCLAVYTILFYWMGHSSAKDQKQYRIINDSQVVLYESNDIFLVSKYQIANEQDKSILWITAEVQTEIEKANTTTTLIQFDDAKLTPKR